MIEPETTQGFVALVPECVSYMNRPYMLAYSELGVYVFNEPYHALTHQTQPNARAMVAVVKVTVKPIASGSTAEITVQRRFLVSFQIVSSVVLHGLCSKLKSIKFTAVSSVQPPTSVSTR